jgi:hypothetical protein
LDVPDWKERLRNSKGKKGGVKRGCAWGELQLAHRIGDRLPDILTVRDRTRLDHDQAVIT